jgi:hypothetical protein
MSLSKANDMIFVPFGTKQAINQFRCFEFLIHWTMFHQKERKNGLLASSFIHLCALSMDSFRDVKPLEQWLGCIYSSEENHSSHPTPNHTCCSFDSFVASDTQPVPLIVSDVIASQISSTA